MRPPDSGSDDLPPREPRERAWTLVSPFVLIVSLLFFGLFLYALARSMEMPHLMDSAFMQIHAGGHALFRVFGLTAAVAGGTFLQLFVPLALGFYFIRQRQSLKPSSYLGSRLAATNPSSTTGITCSPASASSPTTRRSPLSSGRLDVSA
jgi:hypothetical protein